LKGDWSSDVCSSDLSSSGGGGGVSKGGGGGGGIEASMRVTARAFLDPPDII